MLQLRLGMAGYEKSAKSMNGMTQFPSGSVSVKDSYVKNKHIRGIICSDLLILFPFGIFS
jgi:hypothetical protein